MTTKTLRWTLIALVSVCGIAGAQVTRPVSLWFNKVIGVERSRQLYVALHANMWVMYDLPQAVLYHAWQGGTTGGAFVSGAPRNATAQYWFYTGTPQFPHVWRASGTNYFRDSGLVAEYFASYTNPAHLNNTTYFVSGKWPKQPLTPQWGGTWRSWSVRDSAGAIVDATLRFRGYTVLANVITLKFGLILPNNGGEISVSESPEYSNLPSGNHLVRTFTFSGIPASHQVRLEKMGGSNASVWAVTSGSASIVGSAMVQTANGQTVLNGSF